MVAITVPILGWGYDAAFFQPAEVVGSRAMLCSIYTDGPHAYTEAEIQEIRSAGKWIGWNHERGQLDLMNGTAAGTAAANAAVGPVIAAGTPTDGTVAIAYSVDGDPPASEYSQAAGAFQAIRTAHAGKFLVGFYGPLALYKYLKTRGLVDTKCWLSASTSFAGYNPNDPDVGMVQLVGTDIPNTDRNAITDLSGLHAWAPEGGTVTPGEAAQLSDVDAKIVSLYEAVFMGGPSMPDAAKSLGQSVADLRGLLVTVNATLQIIAEALTTSPAVPVSGPVTINVTGNLSGQLSGTIAEALSQ